MKQPADLAVRLNMPTILILKIICQYYIYFFVSATIFEQDFIGIWVLKSKYINAWRMFHKNAPDIGLIYRVSDFE